MQCLSQLFGSFQLAQVHGTQLGAIISVAGTNTASQSRDGDFFFVDF